VLQGKTVVLCVTGGIAAYKAVEVARLLVKAGATVDVVMTENATKFVCPLTFQTLTQRPVTVDMFQLLEKMEIGHISLADRADVIAVVPATANMIAKLAWGLADDMVCCTILAARCPVVVAPAMDHNMWQNDATQRNVAELSERGFHIVPPEEGELASGKIGRGRLAAVETVVGAIRFALSRQGPLVGKTVVVTAGGTREPIDPVRFISNRSSGKMGYAVAQAALDFGAEVQLVTAPTALRPPVGAKVTRVLTAMEMREAVLELVQEADALIMAAAVSDYRVERAAVQKVKSEAEQWVLPLVRNPDIVAEVGASRPARLRALVGFAAETEDVIENASAKVRKKGLDLIVANDVSCPDSGFEVDTNRVSLIDINGNVEQLPLLPKAEVAQRLMERVSGLLAGGGR